MRHSVGQIAFLGSGETSLAGGRIFESLAKKINEPLRIALMETPAGFELNSAQVVGKVGEFMKTRLQNYKPVIDVVPARKKDSTFSPDDPEIVKPLLYANMIFMGPGSPTYAIRQLKDSLAWLGKNKAKCISATVLGVRAAFFSYLALPDGRTAAEVSTPELAQSIPELFGPNVRQLPSGDYDDGEYRNE